MSTSRTVCAAAGALVIAISVAACGSDPNPSASTAGAGASQPGYGRRGFLQDPKVVACLKKQGVTLPSGPRGNGGQPPAGQGQGQPPAGQGQGQPNRRPDSAQMQKLRAAMQKCGVNFGGRPPNGQPPQGQGTTSTSAS